MPAVVRTVWKVYRFELAFVALAIAVLAVATLVQAIVIEGERPTAACWEAITTAAGEGSITDAEAPGCGTLRPWYAAQEQAGATLGVSGFVPILAGALLGSVLVSREVEQRATRLAWWLGPSRWRWLMVRILLVGGLLVVLLIAQGLAANALVGARSIDIDPRMSLRNFGDRDIAIVARGLAIFALSVLVGAVLGRQLPALIVSVALALLLVDTLGNAFPFGAPMQVTPAPKRLEMSTSFQREADWSLGSGDRRRTDGLIFDWDAVVAMAPRRVRDAELARWIEQRFELVDLSYGGEQLTEIELREAVPLGLVALLAFGAAFVVVERREPA